MEKLIISLFITIYIVLVLSLLTGKAPSKRRKEPKSCINCRFDNEYLQDTPCLYCKEHNQWKKK